MAALLTTRAALLQALFAGPGAVPDLLERLRRSGEGLVRLSQARASVELRSLQKDGLVRSWSSRATHGGRGRPRRYFELSGRGIEAASGQRRALRGLAGGRIDSVSSQERRKMSERLAASIAVSDLASALSSAPRRPAP